MQKFFYTIIIVTALFSLVCCPINTDSQSTTQKDSLSGLYGKWINAYPVKPYDDWFEITKDKIFIDYNNGDPTNDIAYNGKIDSVDVSGDYLFLNIKNTVVSRSPWGLAIDSYVRVAIKKESSTRCSMSTGCLPITYDQTADTIANLRNNFTIESGAFEYFGTYNKK